MKTTYLIWKNPSCGGTNPDWQEISGKEFYALVNSPELKERYFVKLPSTNADFSDGVIVMEATETEYLKWKRVKNHNDYLRHYEKPFAVVSYLDVKVDDGDCRGEDLLVDDYDIENEYIQSQELEILKAALTQLSIEERQIIKSLYLSENRYTVRSYSEKFGIPTTTIQRRKVTALNKLKKFFES